MRTRRWILIVLGLTGLTFLMFGIFRQNILEAVILKAERKIDSDFGMKMTVGEAHFSGLSTVALKDVRLFRPGTDTLLGIDTLSVEPSLWRLFTGSLQINSIFCADARMHVVMKKNVRNFSLGHMSADTVQVTESGGRGYGSMLHELTVRAFHFAPQKAVLRNLSLQVENDTVNKKIFLREAISDIKNLHAMFSEEDSTKKWLCDGQFSQSNRTFDITVHPSRPGQPVPLIDELAGMKVSFHRFRMILSRIAYSGGEFAADGKIETDSLTIFHKRISDDEVRIPGFSAEGHFLADKKSITCDSSTLVRLGEIPFHPFLRYDKRDGKRISISIHTSAVRGSDFFNSLPSGMFDEVRDIQADGTLAFHMDFSVDLDNPDSVYFQTSMKKDRFRIRKAGELFKMNGEFIQQVYEYGRYVRSFAVGPSNPYFTPYDQISQDFKNAVMTSEDGSFFYHNGFNEEAFRKSIATNIRAKKFVRGGSTISMQLVKNVFLSRKKTIARKAEEALIVWLIESNRLYSKERMFEVYLNIIELGPDIYGIGEASRFYFSKPPVAITLPEGIFLASLLPHPKWYKSSFDSLGNLKPYLADYYRVVSNFMLRKNMITQEQHDQLQPVIELTGPARDLVVKKAEE